MADNVTSDMAGAFAQRYSDGPDPVGDGDLLASMAARGSCRDFRDAPVADDIIATLCAIAFAAPTKSDLQQRDVVITKSETTRKALADLVGGQAWVQGAPMLAVFCGNNRRQRLLHEWHGVPFANDHMDAPFNAIGDAAIALGAFVTAAEAMGLGCCPISAVRDQAQRVSDLLGLPDHVFPFAGLAFGHPAHPPTISKRLPLSVTCHTDRYDEGDLREAVESYDRHRAAQQPYAAQRFAETFGEVENYAWSTDKVRQYSQPERAGFGAFLKARGFRFD